MGKVPDDVANGVAFDINRFAFSAVCAPHKAYMSVNQTRCPTPEREGTPCNLAWSRVMKFFARLFSARRDANPTTTFERERLGRTMPGQTAALAATRLGVLVS